MKIFGISKTGSPVAETGDFDASKLRWSANRLEVNEEVVVTCAVEDNEVDWIRTRHAREDGNWRSEVCLFPGVNPKRVD